MRVGVLFIAALVTSCGPTDVCGRAQAINAQYREKHAACVSGDPLPEAPFDTAGCTAAMQACSADDEATLQRYLDCLDALPACTPSTRARFQDAFLACANGMTALSSTCAVP